MGLGGILFALSFMTVFITFGVGNFAVVTLSESLPAAAVRSAWIVFLVFYSTVGLTVFVLYRKANRGIIRWQESDAALKESERRFRMLFEMSPEAILLVSEEERIIDCNEAAEVVIQRSKEELTQTNMLDLIVENTTEGFQRTLWNEVLSGEFSGELTLRGGTGEVIPGEVKSRRLQLEEGGLCLVILSDISERKEAENAVLMSEERFSKAFHASPAPTALSTLEDGIIIDANQSFVRMLGYDRQELIGRSSRELGIFVNPDQGAILAEMLRSRGCLHEEHILLQSKSGEMRNVLVSVDLIRFGGEEFLLSLFCDVTERKQAEERLRDSEERLRLLSEFAPFGIALIDAGQGIEYFNPRFTEIFGFSAEESPDFKTWLDHVCPDAIQRESAEPLCAEESGWEAGIGRTRSATVTLRSKEGELKTCLLQSVAIRHGKHVLTAEDITLRTRAEEALRESEEKYRLLVDNANEAIFVLQEGLLKFFNPFTAYLTEFDTQELNGSSFVQMVHPDDRETVLDYDLRILSGQTVPGDFSFRIKSKSGKELWVQQSAVPTKWDGLPATLNFLKDITQQKHLESQLLHAIKMEAVGTLAGGIAHDFNNLLQAILGYADLIRIKKPDAQQWAKELDEIVHAARRGSDLVRQLLTFSRKIDSRLRPVDLNHEILKVKGILERTIFKMISIELSLAPQLKTINADPSQLEQVLINLAVNARDAMPGGGRLSIRTENVTLDETFCSARLHMKPGEYVLLSVADSGHGMDQKTMERIFEPFFTTKETGRGTGLGLPMVYGIIKNHGGFILCDSNLGRGTVFSIYLPVLKRGEGGILDRKGAREGLKGGIETILFVDDEEPLRRYGAEVLSSFGYTVLTAESTQTAVRIYAREWPTIDLIIVDLIMPNQGGMDCMEKLLKINPKARIIVASGHFPDAVTRGLIQERAAAFIQKPYSVESILKTVHSALEKNL